MALPWLLLLAGGLVAAEYKSERQTAQRKRYGSDGQDPGLKLGPSQWLPGHRTVDPTPGTVVACHVFGVVEHTGVWLGDDQIAELHGTGLVRAVSPKRFLHNRSGARIYACADGLHQALGSDLAMTRAAQSLFTFRDYHLRQNNCHRFVWYCLSGEERAIGSFTELNRLLADRFQTGIYWDPLAPQY